MPHRNAQQTKQEIKLQLIKLTAKRGIEGASTKEVAAKIGISEPAIYVHFMTKANLFNETFIFCCHEFEETPALPLSYSKETVSRLSKPIRRRSPKPSPNPLSLNTSTIISKAIILIPRRPEPVRISFSSPSKISCASTTTSSPTPRSAIWPTNVSTPTSATP